MRGEPFTAEADRLPPGETFAEAVRDLRRYAGVPSGREFEAVAAGELALAPLAHPAAGTPVSGRPPYAATIVSERDLQGKELRVCVNAATARRLGLKNGQPARLSAKNGGGGGAAVTRLSVRVAVFEGIMDNVVGLPLGYGHTGFDVFSQGRGADGLELFSLTPELRSGEAEGCHLTVRGLELKGA